jgi:hypothetical protein
VFSVSETPMPRAFGPTMLEKIRLGYADLDTTLEETAQRLGTTKRTMAYLAERCGWPSRRAAISALRRPPIPVEEKGEQGTSGQLAQLRRISARTVAELEAELSTREAADPERTARALATHVRLIGHLQKLQAEKAEEPEPHDEPRPRTLAELRDELRRHLERIRVEQRARGLRGEPEPE